jgi:tetratricopeptide (TPR) repeat protein|tara:strand:- start:1029 stop:2099 length:1071 start_codon:yes stop_codon:yes gene_type:complete
MRLNMFLRTISLLLVATLFYGCPSEELQSARNYVKEKNWEEAEAKLTAAIEVNPEDPEPYFLMGKEIYARNGEWSKMNEMFDKAAELGPTYKLPDTQSLLAAIDTWRTIYWSGEFNKGADNYNLAINSQDSTEKENYFHLAIAGFTMAKEIRPDEATSYKNLVNCYIQIKNQEMLEVTLDEALSINPEDPDLLFTAGRNFMDNDDLDAALLYLERGMEIDPGNSYGAQSLAAAYYMMGDKEGAIFAYTKAIRSDPNNSDVHFNLGILYLDLGDSEMAEEEFLKVLEINPDDTQATIHIGEAYEEMKKFEDAEYYYNRALRGGAENPSLFLAMSRVLLLQGRKDEADEFFEKYKSMK